MAGVILSTTLALTLGRTILVLDAVYSSEKSSVVACATRTIRSIRSSTSQAPGMSPIASPRQQAKGASGSKVRSLHVRLLAMHIAAALSLGAGALKYAVPISDSSCLATHRLMICLALLFDVSLITFLLAKVDLTNGNRTLKPWEKCIIWLTRAYALIYLPFVGIILGLTLPGRASTEGTFCYYGFAAGDVGTMSSNVNSFAAHNATLIVQFVLLLGLFVKPMIVPVEGTQSGGAVYRKVVVRNVVCTASIATTYVIMTVVVIFALLRESDEDNKAAQVRDVAILVSNFVTLCLTEISLPLGFTSCWKVIGTVKKQAGEASRPVTASACVATKIKVAPVEELPPHTP